MVRALETRERVAAGFAPLTRMQAQMLVEYVAEITQPVKHVMARLEALKN